MAHHLVRSVCSAAIATALALQGCDKPSPGRLDRSSHVAASRGAAADSPAFRNDMHRGSKTSEGSSAASARPVEPYQTDDPSPWLAELLHAPDPNVRIQALDAWAREPSASLDPVTYALVDPDEFVRARAQEVLERELARR